MSKKTRTTLRNEFCINTSDVLLIVHRRCYWQRAAIFSSPYQSAKTIIAFDTVRPESL
ncbi:hypothetical protein [Pseudomonas phage PseuP_222]|nr:hypothetical protein [Pseudomonas phage PseuP_222]